MCDFGGREQHAAHTPIATGEFLSHDDVGEEIINPPAAVLLGNPLRPQPNLVSFCPQTVNLRAVRRIGRVIQLHGDGAHFFFGELMGHLLQGNLLFGQSIINYRFLLP